MNELAPFFEKLDKSYTEDTFVKITLSKPAYKSDGLHNVYVRIATIKGERLLSFTYHYQTNDQVKNYTLEEAKGVFSELLNLARIHDMHKVDHQPYLNHMIYKVLLPS